jgi:predicted small integral membrane protein
VSWMAWTTQTAAFFVCIGTALLLMTVWEIFRPTGLARGFLPMPTTRGDRFFISLLSAAFIHLIWMGTVTDYLVIASALSVVWAALLMRWG